MPEGYVSLDYLTKLAVQLENIKRQSYQKLRAEPGKHILDVACGPATDTIPIAKLVGERGLVVGIDRDPQMILEANQRARESGVEGWTQHRVANAASLPFENESFDAVRADRLFQHLQNPAAVFAEMVRVTRRGGWLVVLDTDYASTSIALDEHELERKFVRVALEHSVSNAYAARELLGLFRAEHLVDTDITPIPLVYREYQMARELGRWDTIEQLALDTNAFTPHELERWRASGARAAQGGFFLQVNMILTFGRKE